MSAFKRLNRQDVFITPYTAKKRWIVSGSLLSSSYGVEGVYAQSGSINKYYYASVDHLYYKDFISGSYISGSRDLSLQSTVPSGSRIIGNSVFIFSFPRDVVGTAIEPGSFYMQINGGGTTYVPPGYVQEGYVV